MTRSFLYFICGLLVSSCLEQPVAEEGNEAKSSASPQRLWHRSMVYYDRSDSRWKSKEDTTLISGRVVSYFPDSTISETVKVQAGKKEGARKCFYPDGALSLLENYEDNKLHGKVQRWGAEGDHTLRAELNYHHGKLNGLQRKWFDSGEIHKVMQMKHGKEDGMQKAYRKNGVLYANYEAKNGRSFGLRKSQLCYELNEEQTVYAP